MGVGGVQKADHPINRMEAAGRTFVKMSGLSSYLTVGAGLILPALLTPPPGAILSNNTTGSSQSPR